MRTITKYPYKSKFEKSVAESLERRGADFEYEAYSYEYTLTSWYTPDWFIRDGIVVETKGSLTASERRKILAFVEQHPDVDYRIVFMKDNPIRKGSKTKYSDWARSHGIPFAIGDIPDEWIK